MKVAIIGAGLAGLTCAHELEKYGIYPDIYEKNSFIGEQHPHVGAFLEVGYRKYGDILKYFKKKLDIDITPLNTVNHIVHYSPNKVNEISGNLGYFIERDKSNIDLKNQLYKKLTKSHVIFNVYGDYEELTKNYDYVVIANGSMNYTNELGCWQEWLNTYVKGAIVSGDFDINTLLVWINQDYCKKGYAYLTPFNNKKASLVLIVTDIDEQEVDIYWQLFLSMEKLRYPIVEEFKLNHKSGYVYPHQIENIYFAGNALGVIDPFLGFGQLNAIISGYFTAQSIALGKDYEKLLKNILLSQKQLHEFRKAFDRAGSLTYDIIVSSVNFPGINHIAYHSPINIIKYGGNILKILPKKKEKNR